VWTDDAACKGRPKTFDTTMVIDGEEYAVPRAVLDKAREICTTCPVMMQCMVANDRRESMYKIRGESRGNMLSIQEFRSKYSCVYAGETPAERYRRRVASGKRVR
jgi:hypothetical protein